MQKLSTNNPQHRRRVRRFFLHFISKDVFVNVGQFFDNTSSRWSLQRSSQRKLSEFTDRLAWAPASQTRADSRLRKEETQKKREAKEKASQRSAPRPHMHAHTHTRTHTHVAPRNLCPEGPRSQSSPLHTWASRACAHTHTHTLASACDANDH